jgi:uncharacterized protein (DUF849 family)
MSQWLPHLIPLVVTIAPTGMVARKQDGAAVPEQPDEIVADVKCAARAGASCVHLHARDESGAPTYEADYYAHLVRAVRCAVPDIVISVSTSGRVHQAFEQRAAVLDLDGRLKPDLASLTLGSMNFPTQASVNDPAMIARLAAAMRERGIVPELEIFDLGMLDYAAYLIERGVLGPPFVFNLLLGSRGMLAATPLNLALLVERLPRGAYWQAAGIGRFQWPMNALGVICGGHVRTGLEDNLYLDIEKQRPASNIDLVMRATRLATDFGRPIATTSQARRLMGLADSPC